MASQNSLSPSQNELEILIMIRRHGGNVSLSTMLKDCEGRFSTNMIGDLVARLVCKGWILAAQKTVDKLLKTRYKLTRLGHTAIQSGQHVGNTQLGGI